MRRTVAIVSFLVGACGGATATVATNGSPDAGEVVEASIPETSPPAPETGADAAPDAPKPPPPWIGIPELAACRATPYEIHVSRTTEAGVGAWGVDGTRGTWGGMLTAGEIVKLDVTSGEGWQVIVTDDAQLVPKQYVVGERYPRIAVLVDPNNALRCGKYEGTFTIVEVGGVTQSDQTALARLVVHFDLTCVADQARVRGCIRYGI